MNFVTQGNAGKTDQLPQGVSRYIYIICGIYFQWFVVGESLCYLIFSYLEVLALYLSYQ